MADSVLSASIVALCIELGRVMRAKGLTQWQKGQKLNHKERDKVTLTELNQLGVCHHRLRKGEVSETDQ